MRFFFDNCISHKLAQAINALVQPEHSATHLRNRWPVADTKPVTDVEWITTLGREGEWIVISGDLRIRTRPGEREALRSAKLTTFFMAKSYPQLPDWEQVRWLIDKWPDIVKFASDSGAGSTFEVPKQGKIRTL
jgi:hypothetical protein